MFSDQVPMPEVSTTSIQEKIFGSTEDMLVIVIPMLLGIAVGILSVIDVGELKVVKFIKKKLSG